MSKLNLVIGERQTCSNQPLNSQPASSPRRPTSRCPCGQCPRRRSGACWTRRRGRWLSSGRGSRGSARPSTWSSMASRMWPSWRGASGECSWDSLRDPSFELILWVLVPNQNNKVTNLQLHAVCFNWDRLIGTISKFWGHVVCPFVCMSVCVYVGKLGH